MKAKELAVAEPESGSVEIVNGIDKGLKITWDQKGVQLLEEKDGYGDWQPISGVQKLTIEFDIHSVLPLVTMERYVI